MVRDKHPSKTESGRLLKNSREARDKIIPVDIVQKNTFPFNATADDMVKSAWGVYAGLSRHGDNIATVNSDSNAGFQPHRSPA